MKSSGIKNPIGLKEYCHPSIKIVLLDEGDIVATSQEEEEEEEDPDGSNNAPRRSNHIFDDF